MQLHDRTAYFRLNSNEIIDFISRLDFVRMARCLLIFNGIHELFTLFRHFSQIYQNQTKFFNITQAKISVIPYLTCRQSLALLNKKLS